jgi:hypothetical protein
MFRWLALSLAALAVGLFVSLPVQADDRNADTHTGKVVSAAGNKLIMTDKDGKNEHTHTLGLNVKVSLDGKDAKLDDLKPGMMVRVTTTKEGEKKHVTRIEASTKGLDNK